MTIIAVTMILLFTDQSVSFLRKAHVSLVSTTDDKHTFVDYIDE